MKLEPAARATSSGGVACQLFQSVVYGNSDVGGGDAVDHQLRVARVGGGAAERVAPDQRVRSRGLGLDAPADRLAQPRIAVREPGARVARDRRAPLARQHLAVDGRETGLVFLDESDAGRADRCLGARVGRPAARAAAACACRRGAGGASAPPLPAAPAPVPAVPGVPASGTRAAGLDEQPAAARRAANAARWRTRGVIPRIGCPAAQEGSGG